MIVDNRGEILSMYMYLILSDSFYIDHYKSLTALVPFFLYYQITVKKIYHMTVKKIYTLKNVLCIYIFVLNFTLIVVRYLFTMKKNKKFNFKWILSLFFQGTLHLLSSLGSNNIHILFLKWYKFLKKKGFNAFMDTLCFLCMHT